LAASAGIVVPTNEHAVGLKDHLVGARWSRRLGLERHIGEEVTLIEAVEVDLEGAVVGMRLVCRVVVESHAINLDRPIVAWWVLGEGWGRQAGERHASSDGCRPAGPACKSSNLHEFPREGPRQRPPV
jgi:hypothetical protein